MNIVFSSIFDFTQVYREIADVLEGRGHRVFWITTDRYWTDWLIGRGTPQSTILELLYREEDFLDDREEAKLRHEIAECERGSHLTLNQAMLMDRFIPRLDREKINHYMFLYFRDIGDFLAKNEISIVFAEPTHVNELVTYMICRRDGIRFLAPWDMRYPHHRMMFCEGYLQADMIRPRPEPVVPGEGAKLLREFEERQTTPVYFEKHNKSRVISMGRLLGSVRNRISRGQILRQPNLTHHSVGERAGRMLSRVRNSIYLKHLSEYDSLSSIPDPIAFYGLHVQPESSIDVRGSFFSDQIKLIKDIRRSLPCDTMLVVKEHPNFLGIRGRAFFRQLRQIPNVALVRHDVSTFDIYKRASIVFTVSGTLAYEAGMLGIPAVTFSPMYFGKLSTVHYCGDITKLKVLVEHIREAGGRDWESDCRAMEDMLAVSYAGHWVDPFNDPSVLERGNIERIAGAFAEVVEYAGD